jgi:hypothetical protein
MSVTSVDVRHQGPYANGRRFGSGGPARIERFVLSHRVDPGHPANASIVDLTLAERGEDGLVGFDHDVVVIEPVDPAVRNGWVLVDIVNRGRPTVPGHLHLDDSPPFPPPPEPAPGDGHLLEQGWTIAHVGWQFDVDHPALMGLRAPGLAGERPPEGEITYVMTPVAAVSEMLVSLPGHRPFPCADPGAAVVTAEHPDGTVVHLERGDWDFTADGRKIRLDSGFEPGVAYRCRYRATGAVVTGCGLLALRDVVPWLRSSRGIDSAVLFGVSQCGRVARQFLAEGLNADLAGRQVYEGVLPVIAGARLGEFNMRYANAGLLPSGGDGLDDRARYGSLLASSDEAGVTPKVIAVNTSTEYWRGDAALVHDDPHPDVRVHHVTGTQHSPGVVPQLFEDPYFGTKGRYGFNTVDYRPVVRALLGQLVSWAADGVAPADDVVPGPGELTDRRSVLEAFERHGITTPDPDSFGVPEGPVPAVDDSLNELGGIRLPDVAVPLGVHAGWNLRHPDIGAPRRQLLLRGSTWLLEERPSLAAYLAAVIDVVDDLVERRFLLTSDAALVVRHAEDRWRASAAAAERDID